MHRSQTHTHTNMIIIIKKSLSHPLAALSAAFQSRGRAPKEQPPPITSQTLICAHKIWEAHACISAARESTNLVLLGSEKSRSPSPTQRDVHASQCVRERENGPKEFSRLFNYVNRIRMKLMALHFKSRLDAHEIRSISFLPAQLMPWSLLPSHKHSASQKFLYSAPARWRNLQENPHFNTWNSSKTRYQITVIYFLIGCNCCADATTMPIKNSEVSKKSVTN